MSTWSWERHRPFSGGIHLADLLVEKKTIPAGSARPLARIWRQHGSIEEPRCHPACPLAGEIPVCQADKILVNSPAYVDYMVSKGVKPEKWPSFLMAQMWKCSIRRWMGHLSGQNLDWSSKFVVLYAGALGQANDIYTLLRAADRLKARGQDQDPFTGRWKRKGEAGN